MVSPKPPGTGYTDVCIFRLLRVVPYVWTGNVEQESLATDSRIIGGCDGFPMLEVEKGFLGISS